MTPDSQDFRQLRQLMALKRHEQPPPGYFNRFSRDVVARIKAGERGESRPSGFMERFWALLEAKPIFAGAFGASMCAVLISGLLNAEESPGIAGNLQPVAAGDGAFGPGPGLASAADTVSHTVGMPEPALQGGTESGALDHLFEFQPRLNAVPAASWAPAH